MLAGMQACNSTKAKETNALKFNLQKGKSYAYTMEVDMENDFNGQKMNSEMNFDYDLSVVADNDSFKTIKSTYKKVVMNMKMPNMTVDIDSDKPAADTATDMKNNPMAFMGNMFRAIIGKSFTMKVNPEGQVTEVTGLKEMGEAMLASMKMSEEMRPMVEQSFKEQFNEDNLKQSFSQAFNIFPNREVKVGDTWDKTVTMGGMMAATTKTTYTVKDIKNGKVYLDVNATTDVQNTKVTQTGTLTVDQATGLVTEGELEQKTEGMFKSVSKTVIRGREL